MNNPPVRPHVFPASTRPRPVPRLIGMVHLLPLPGSPGWRGSRGEILDRALRDTATLVRAGFDAVLVENYGDAPFRKNRVDLHTVADMTRIVAEIARACPLPIGVQVLRNDASAAMSIAAACGAAFVRVNVHSGAMLTDQGLIEGQADETLRLRMAVSADVRVYADVHVKHAVPLAPQSIEDAAMDTVERGGADAVIVSGTGTGREIVFSDLERVKRAVSVPVIVGSGVHEDTIRRILETADAVIVGTAIKTGAVPSAPVSGKRASALVRAARA